jgi:uncharacterized protein with ATP-grasp and redox domains
MDIAVRLSVAANVIDLGAYSQVGAVRLRREIDEALSRPLHADVPAFERAVGAARRILFIADNAGEIVLDRLLVERLSPPRVTVAVRAGPVVNDATYEDARTAAHRGGPSA